MDNETYAWICSFADELFKDITTECEGDPEKMREVVKVLDSLVPR